MKIYLPAIIILIALSLFNCTSIPNPETKMEFTMEDIQMKERIENQEITNFFTNMGIKVNNREKAQFIVGDNIDGYYEGYTNSYVQGNGYLMGSRTIYKNFKSFINGVFLDRKSQTISQTVLPYGTIIELNNNIKEEFALHSKTRSLSMAVNTETLGLLGVYPIINGDFKDYEYINNNKELYLKDGNSIIVFTANQPYKFKDGLFTSINKTDNFILYMAFADSEVEAQKKAKELREIEAHSYEKKKIYNLLTNSYIKTDDLEFNKAVNWAKYSAYTMVVEEFGKGIWAGLPWFKDNWGRDTFIALPGTLLVSGHFSEAKEVLNNFIKLQNIGNPQLVIELQNIEVYSNIKRFLKTQGLKIKRNDNNYTVPLTKDYILDKAKAKTVLDTIIEENHGVSGRFEIVKDESYGRVPNRVTSLDNIIYNTTDGTPWLIREIYEYISYTGDLDYGREIFPFIITAMDGVIQNFLDKDSFMTHDDADTWMDARINNDKPWSARGSRAVEIQVLWYSMLQISSYLATINNRDDLSQKWQLIADRLKYSFNDKFWDEDNKRIADRLREDDTPDFKARPNQLMAISIPLISPIIDSLKEAYIVKNSTTDLLYQYGIASLSEDEEYFHPYHENLRYNHKDAAYHNGVIWGWNAGLIVEGLTKYGYNDLSYSLTKNLSRQILTMGTLGSMSENLSVYPDKRGNLILSGTYSQAWSVSEFSRNAYQNYIGFSPRLIDNTIEFTPSFPNIWSLIDVKLPFGVDEYIYINGVKKDDIWEFKLDLISNDSKTLIWDGAKFVIEPGKTVFNWNPTKSLSNRYKEIIGPLKFREINLEREFPMYEKKNKLQEIINNDEYR